MGKYALLIVSALIFSMLTYSHALRNALFISNTRTVQSYSQNQAHNIAQSALMVAFRDMNDDGGNITIPSAGNTWETGFQPWSDMHGEFNIEVFNDDVNDIIRVQSTGRFEDAIYRATAGLVAGGGGGGFPWPDFDGAVYSDEDLTVNGSGKITGDVYTNGMLYLEGGGAEITGNAFIPSTIENPALRFKPSSKIIGNVYTNTTFDNSIIYEGWDTHIYGDLYVGPGADPDVVGPKISQWFNGSHVSGNSAALSEPIPQQEMEMPEFPEIPQNQMPLPPINLSGVDHQVLDLTSGHVYVPEITINSSTNLDIIVGNQDRILRVSDLDLAQGHLNIISEGEGRLQLYVENYFNIGGSSTMNNNPNPEGNVRSPLSLLIAYAGESDLTLDGAQLVNANFFVKDANVKLTAGSNFQGNIITGGEEVEISGDSENYSRVIYAPNANVNMEGSGKITGSVVGKSFSGVGNFRVTYSNDFQDTLPDLGGEGGNASSLYSIAFWN